MTPSGFGTFIGLIRSGNEEGGTRGGDSRMGIADIPAFARRRGAGQVRARWSVEEGDVPPLARPLYQHPVTFRAVS